MLFCPSFLGLGLIAFALFAWVKVWRLERHGQRVTAEIIEVPRVTVARGRKVKQERAYEVIVRYRPPDEEPLELRVVTSGHGANFEVGQHIQLIYDPKKPEARAILPGQNQWVGPLILGIVGLILILANLLPAWNAGHFAE